MRGMRLRRAWLVVVSTVLLLCVGCDEVASSGLPDATEKFFVNDYADILSDTDEATVFEAGVNLQNATGAQVVLLTVDDLGGMAMEDYTLTIARNWGIGDAEKDNGILLLFTTDGPHSRVEVGYGLEGALPDSKAGRILDNYLVPWYDDADAWSAQLTDTYRALVNEVYAEYGMTESQFPLEMPFEDEDEGDLIMIIPMLIILILLLSSKRRGIFFLPHFGGFNGGSGFYGGGGFRGGGGFSGGGGGFGGGGASR